MTQTQVQDPYQGLNATLAQRIKAMIAASHGALRIESGYRSDAQQTALYQQAVQKYGAADAGQWVAPPGHSNHEKGLAVDLTGDLGIAHQLAPQFGLVFPMSWEPWHVELVGTREKASHQAYTAVPGSVNPKDDPSLNSRPDFLAARLTDSLAQAHEVATQGVLQGGAQTAAETSPGTARGVNTNATDSGQPIPMRSGGGAYGGVDPGKWAHDFLTKLGKPTTPENIRAVEAWQQAESGGGGGKFNPLNTTQGGYQGESNLNSVGVKNYQSYEDGIAANVQVINNGYYKPILDALSSGKSAMAVAQAIAQTPWGTGGGVVNVLAGQ